MKLFDFNSKDIGMDLGKGIVLREPSVVALDKINGEIVATGKEARDMLGRTPENIKAVRPMQDGVIADFTATQLMLKNMLRKVCQKYNAGKPRVVVGVPSGITEVERKAIEEAFLQANAREVYLIQEPMAAAIGAGLNVKEANGHMIIDIGGGTTEVAVISLGGIVASTSVKVAGNEIDESIVEYLKRKKGIAIGLSAAENLKIELGCALPLVSEISKQIRGRDLDTGLPKTIEVSSKDIEEAMKKPISEIIEAIIGTLSNTPPELASDIIINGIYLAGGGAQIRNLDSLIAKKTGVQTFVADAPLECVAIGAGKVLENIESLKGVLMNSEKTY